jgi:hypothetical protein
MPNTEIILVSSCLANIKRRTFTLQLFVGAVALFAICLTFYLILAERGLETGTKLGLGGILTTILTSCSLATFRLHTCLNSVDATELYLKMDSREQAEKTLNGSACLKGSGLQGLIQEKEKP